jgi:hypothetical protein
MNKNNYCTLEAAQRLVDAGIVLETEAIWVKWYFGSSTVYDRDPYEWRLMYKGLSESDCGSIPAPSMAEVWRELPAGTTLYRGNDLSEAFIYPPFRSKISKIDANPTDALIDLLIWVKAQKEEGL